MSRGMRSAIRRVGAGLAGVGLVFATAVPAAATSTYGYCSSGQDNFDFAVNYKTTTGSRFLIQSYSYKIYGPIRDHNNIEMWLEDRVTGDPVPNSRKRLDEIPETSSTAWTRVEIPDYAVSMSHTYFGSAYAVFDEFGLDPSCDAFTPPF